MVSFHTKSRCQLNKPSEHSPVSQRPEVSFAPAIFILLSKGFGALEATLDISLSEYSGTSLPRYPHKQTPKALDALTILSPVKPHTSCSPSSQADTLFPPGSCLPSKSVRQVAVSSGALTVPLPGPLYPYTKHTRPACAIHFNFKLSFFPTPLPDFAFTLEKEVAHTFKRHHQQSFGSCSSGPGKQHTSSCSSQSLWASVPQPLQPSTLKPFIFVINTLWSISLTNFHLSIQPCFTRPNPFESLPSISCTGQKAGVTSTISPSEKFPDQG